MDDFKKPLLLNVIITGSSSGNPTSTVPAIPVRPSSHTRVILPPGTRTLTSTPGNKASALPRSIVTIRTTGGVGVVSVTVGIVILVVVGGVVVGVVVDIVVGVVLSAVWL